MQLGGRILGYVPESIQKFTEASWERICSEFANLRIMTTVGMSSRESPTGLKRKRESDLFEEIEKLEEKIERLEQENGDLRSKVAARDEEVQKLEQQLDLAEHRNSHNFVGGESFLDTCATPHLLNKAVERVNSASSNFTKLVMHALQHHGGVDCPSTAKAVAKSVVFERVAHTKYVYQALVCKVLFTDFENECFNVDENAPQNVLNPEQLSNENFQEYKVLTALENPEELVFEDATDNDFRKLCNKKRQDMVVALSKTQLAPGVADVGALLFGKVYGPEGIRRSQRETPQYQVKIASTFAKFVLSVFLVHKLAFALRPVARIFRVREGATFNATHMEAVVALADSEDDDGPLVPLSAAFMVVPGFHVNRIIVHSRVYAVKRIVDNPSESRSLGPKPWDASS
ncbi:hypothetical protein KC19_4G070000 [Ceratodon purpureus]|uniref:GIL1/IRKI C-terminal domain-containing protein n=1 Tax=Ceratodon purpureus TaxID=3225 RepID=A0A8T0I9B6_CERPU|nr:hypothetical protein KC19_4G070000 [Ceratodon purpureus]